MNTQGASPPRRLQKLGVAMPGLDPHVAPPASALQDFTGCADSNIHVCQPVRCVAHASCKSRSKIQAWARLTTRGLGGSAKAGSHAPHEGGLSTSCTQCSHQASESTSMAASRQAS